MDFKIGDKVSFLNEALDGVVTRIIDNDSLEVTTSDGFGIPVLKEELVKSGDASFSNNQLKGHNQETIKSAANVPFSKKYSIERKPYLCFSNKDSKAKEVFLLNNTHYTQFYAIRVQRKGEYVLLYSGKVNKQSYTFIGAFEGSELEVFNKLFVDSLSLEFSEKERMLPKSIELKIKPQKLFKDSSYKEIPILNKECIAVDVSGEFVQKIEADKEPVALTPKKEFTYLQKGPKIIGKIELKPKKRGRSREELDLHIEKLGVKYKGKTNAQIVQIQLGAAKSFIDQSILAGKREIVLIHGVGNGRLKDEVHKLLKSYYGIRFESADIRLFGEGATLVHLKG
ncbi:MAG: hypothetical protein CMP61_10925 [Flavobacteriales bacterium]|nr:hypothetical protein [Flavobacteriales bacterium]|tara:strand:- start:4363 stop:5382 length:1020 start_codon:yes stop_codon:yes gene_type:complete